MGVVVRRYIDILTIIINFPYATCISAFLAAASLLLSSFKKCFFILKTKNAKWRFFPSRCAHVNCAIMVLLYTHFIGNPPQNTMVVFEMRDSVPSARYSPICKITVIQ